MAKPMLTDELWTLIEPLLPPPRKYPKGGRPRVGDRQALMGILFVLRTGIPWEYLPQEMGCGSGMTCWRRLHDWQEAGVWEDILHMVLNQLQKAGRLDWSRAVVDSSSVRAVFGGPRSGRTPPIGARAARSTTSLRMPMAFPWPRQSRARIAMM